jgi:hypothetical protein
MNSDYPSSGTYATLVPVLIAAFVVIRFAFRELKLRTVRTPAIWIRPGLLVVITIVLAVMSFTLDPSAYGITIVLLLAGGVLGACTGLAIIANTTFSSAGVRNAVKVQGSRITLAIWIGALVVRFLARFLFTGGTTPKAQLPLNCGTVALVAVAFVVIAVAYTREMRRFAPL